MSIVDALHRLISRQPKPAAPEEHIEDRESPILIELGVVRQVVLGNSASGKGDANTQYYW